MEIDASNARGLRFRCLPGCGFCCAVSPSVLPAEEAGARAAGLPVLRREDGSLGLPMLAGAGHCALLDAGRSCARYADRPFACGAFPVQLHALDRLQADLHLGCPGMLGEGEDAEAFALRVAGDAVRVGAIDFEGARRNAEEARRRLREVGVVDPGEILAAFEGLDPTDPRTLGALYAAASVPDLEPEDVPEALADAPQGPPKGLAALLGELAAETPPRAVDRVEPTGFAWKPLDLRKATPSAALSLPAETRAPLARHAGRLLARDLTWGHALALVEGTGWEVSPAAALARALADCGGQLVLRAARIGDGASAVASFEGWYWGLPTIGAAL